MPGRSSLRLKTNKEKLHKELEEFEAWIKRARSLLKSAVLWEKAQAKIQGHYNYLRLLDE